LRLLVTLLFFLFAFAAVILTLTAPESSLTHWVQATDVVLFILVVLDRLFGLFRPRRRNRTPPSLVAEIERLYFRSMREMLNETPNLVQVINDLQRILSIDPNYKNTRHYLNRAIVLQAESRDKALANNQPVSGDEATFMRLQDQLIDPDPVVRKSVVMELIQYGEHAVDPLIALLMDEDSDVRVHAATALGWVGGTDAVQPLLVALQDENNYVRRYAARALCWVVDDTAIDGLIAALQDGDNYVRRYAARALGWSQDKRAVLPLLELLSRDDNSDVREYTLIALDDLGEHDVKIERPVEVAE
jgi:HEAT repeat protein